MRVKADQGVTLLGGAVANKGIYDLLRARAPLTAAADGGANQLRDWGIWPDYVIGDLDSLANQAFWRDRLGERLVALSEQNSTDFEKCLYTIDAPLFLALGFWGGRIDHSLAALHALAAYPEKKTVLIGETDLAFWAPLRWRARLKAGARVSVWPLWPTRGLASEGLRWPLEDLDLAPGRRIGTSNEATQENVSILFDRPGAVIVLPLEWLDAAIASLRESP